MTGPRRRHLEGLLDTHLEEIAFLGRQRRAATLSARHDLRSWRDLEERIEAHLDGVASAPAPQRHARLTLGLEQARDRDTAFAVGLALVRDPSPSVRAPVVAALCASAGERLEGLRDALGMSRTDDLREALVQVLASGAHGEAVSAAAAVALANRRALHADMPGLDRLLHSEEAPVLAWAWRVVPAADGPGPRANVLRPYMVGVTHADAEVRAAAWAAASWTGQAPALPLLRARAEGGDEVALHWWAVLAGPDDAGPAMACVSAWPDAVARSRLWARLGHPDALPLLLQAMDQDDADLVQAAFQAFERITGADVRGRRGPAPVPAQADEFERLMAPDLWWPDPQRARQIVAATDWRASSRWCAGQDRSQPCAASLAGMDMQARWDAAWRAAWTGRRISQPPPVH